MPKTKAQKQTIVEKLEQQVEKTPSMVFVDVAGLKIKDLGVLRASLKKTGAKLQVAKKTLLAKVFEKRGIQANLKHMAGEIAAIFPASDPFPALKEAYKFAKINEHFKLRGAYLQGALQNEQHIMQLAQLPAREELLSQFMRTLTNPISGFMNVLQGNTKGLIRVLAQAKTAN
jgi:large subunit ribosomal protein L10